LKSFNSELNISLGNLPYRFAIPSTTIGNVPFAKGSMRFLNQSLQFLLIEKDWSSFSNSAQK